MKKIMICFAVVIGVVSCSSQPAVKEEVSELKSYSLKVQDESGVEKEFTWDGQGEMPVEMKVLMQNKQGLEGENYLNTATLAIEGMSCQKMCAGLINKTLSEAQGVKKCKVNFEEKVAVVEYDNEQIDETKMIQLVEGLHEGQYQVKSVEIRKELSKEIESLEEKEG